MDNLTRKFVLSTIIILALGLILTGCDLPNDDEVAATMVPSNPQTAAAETVAAHLTDSITPTSPPAEATSTPESEITQPASPTITADVEPSMTPSLTDNAEFDSDVTIPDGTIFLPGESFTKTWRLRNTGESTWSTEYAVVFDHGDQLDGPSVQPFSEEVEPGDTVEISIDLVAPDEDGLYIGHWILRNPSGIIFGTGPDADETFYVVINVVSPGGGTVTPTPISDGIPITDASLSVDQSSYSGQCPVTLTFPGVIYSQGQGSFAYQLEAGSQTQGFQFFLPSPYLASYNTGGTHRLDVEYTLDIENSVDGWARLTITSDTTYHSNTVNFNVTCQP